LYKLGGGPKISKAVNRTQVIYRTDKILQENKHIFEKVTKIYETVLDKNSRISSNTLSTEKSTTVIGEGGKVLKEFSTGMITENKDPSELLGTHLKSVT